MDYLKTKILQKDTDHTVIGGIDHTVMVVTDQVGADAIGHTIGGHITHLITPTTGGNPLK